MALKPKTDLLQIRVEPGFLAKLKVWADYEERPLSDLVRRVLMRNMDQFEDHLSKKRLQLVDGVLIEMPPESAALSITNAHIPSDDMTRQQRRAKERDERKGR